MVLFFFFGRLSTGAGEVRIEGSQWGTCSFLYLISAKELHEVSQISDFSEIIIRANSQFNTHPEKTLNPPSPPKKSPNFRVGLVKKKEKKRKKTGNTNRLSQINDLRRVRWVELLYLPHYIFAGALCSELLMDEPDLLKEKRTKFIEIKTCNPLSGKMRLCAAVEIEFLRDSSSHMTPSRANSRAKAHLSFLGNPIIVWQRDLCPYKRVMKEPVVRWRESFSSSDELHALTRLCGHVGGWGCQLIHGLPYIDREKGREHKNSRPAQVKCAEESLCVSCGTSNISSSQAAFRWLFQSSSMSGSRSISSLGSKAKSVYLV